MLDFSLIELVLVLVVALLVLRPEDMPTVLRGIGRALGKMKALVKDFSDAIHQATDFSSTPGPHETITDMDGAERDAYRVDDLAELDHSRRQKTKEVPEVEGAPAKDVHP